MAAYLLGCRLKALPVQDYAVDPLRCRWHRVSETESLWFTPASGSAGVLETMIGMKRRSMIASSFCRLGESGQGFLTVFSDLALAADPHSKYFNQVFKFAAMLRAGFSFVNI
jgi:hypothetical protein